MTAYTAVKAFGPSWGENWTNYVTWSRLDHLEEVISLDSILCSSIVPGVLTAEDCNHMVYNEMAGWLELFGDLDYLLGRIGAGDRRQVLAVVREPTQETVASFADRRFDFKGYDLVEVGGGISALTNCGGFDQAFSNDDLSPWGLIPGHESAYHIRDLLRKHYPDEPHADCHVWAIWRMEKLSDYFRGSPLVGAELDLIRDSSPTRDESVE